jgi:SagB-type dehydrogenase family enzyme
VASPHVVAYWHAGRFVIHHVPTSTRRHADPLAALILQFFQTPHSEADLVSATAPAYRRVFRQTVAELVRLGFLHRADRKTPARDRALQGWGDWNPAVSFFHFSTRDRPWATGVQRDRAESAFRRKALDGAVPPEPVKRHGTAPAIALPRPPRSGEFAQVLLARRTWRGFGRQPLTLEALAELLQLTWGVQRWGEAGAGDRVAFKTSPSGGGRTALEAYVLALRVKGLARGLYHYVADEHKLERLRAGATARQVEGYLGGQWFFRPAAALVLMTAVVERVRWRYPHAESYASVLLEAGHFCQTFCLVATWLKLAPFCTVALANSRIERDLGIDGVSEVLLYAAGVGTPPADGQWVQWPRHLPGHPYLPPHGEPRPHSTRRSRASRPRRNDAS